MEKDFFKIKVDDEFQEGVVHEYYMRVEDCVGVIWVVVLN